jgi:1-phosphatidylinositol-4-phosphate 5-kinase
MNSFTATPGPLSLHLRENAIVSQEVHIVKVAGDSVQLEQGAFFQNFSKSSTQVVPSGKSSDDAPDASYPPVGPPPPSPPPSVTRDEKEDENTRPTIPRLVTSRSEYGPRTPKTSFRTHERSPSLSSCQVLNTKAGPSNEQFRSTTATVSILPAHITLNNSSVPNQRPDNAEASSSRTSKFSGHLSTDSHLQPSLSSLRHPARRNTTGSSPKIVKAVPMHRHDYGYSQPYAYEDGDDELANDIQLHAEQIRRERMSKRAKAQQEAEAALTGPPGTLRRQPTTEDSQPLVGNLIGEDHVNYVLMYNMLTGIRIGVSSVMSLQNHLLTRDFFRFLDARPK